MAYCISYIVAKIDSLEESINPNPEDLESNALYNILYPSKELLPDDKEMSIFDHLEELRQRIFVSVLAVGAAILGCFAFSKQLIFLLEAPVSSQGVRFLQLSPGEFFFTTIKVNVPFRIFQKASYHLVVSHPFWTATPWMGGNSIKTL